MSEQIQDGGERVLTVQANGRNLGRTERAVWDQLIRLRLQGYSVKAFQIKAYVARERGRR